MTLNLERDHSTSLLTRWSREVAPFLKLLFQHLDSEYFTRSFLRRYEGASGIDFPPALTNHQILETGVRIHVSHSQVLLIGGVCSSSM